MRISCPEDGTHQRFQVVVREYHDWLVNDKGDLVEDLGCTDCDPGDEYQCAECGAQAEVDLVDEQVRLEERSR